MGRDYFCYPHVICADILSVNPHDMPACDILLASPPCPNFSIAKAGGKETDLDIALARLIGNAVPPKMAEALLKELT